MFCIENTQLWFWLPLCCGLRLYLFLKLRFSSTVYSVCVPLSGCRSEYVFLLVMCCLHCYVGIHFAKIVHLFQMSKKRTIFSSSAHNFNICRYPFVFVPLLMLNGSHPMNVSHQHFHPLPLSLLAVFLGKGIAICSIYLSSCPADIYPIMSVAVQFV